MDRLPPTILRRVVLAPLVFVLSILALTFAPVALLVAAAVDFLTPGYWRAVRILGFVTVYLAMEVVGLAAMFVLWLASGFGLAMRSDGIQSAHFAFMRWWLGVINRTSRVLFQLKIVIEDRPEPRPGPILVFSRHAGPGNSLLLIGTIMIGYARHPRIVMLAKLQWEPLFDVMLNRVPNRFIRHDPARRERYVETITELATGLGDSDAFVLFPEGKDFTPRVRRRAIDYLRAKGHDLAAERAEKMEYMLPPRHNGVLAAMQGSPEADVVLVAHSVLEDIGSFKDLWHAIPFEEPIHARYWRIPQQEVPHDTDELIEWLYGWWERIDAWIAERVAIPKPSARPPG
ncbi:MAG TPA: 1-acyl-sn-glycerol-3-phosphate acyltransferase [Actinomycetota bacterium]